MAAQPLPAALPLSGEPVAFRAIRGPEDAPALHTVHLGRQAADGIDPLSRAESFPSLDSLARSLAQAVEKGEAARWRVAEAGDAVAGYGRIADWPEADGTRVYLVSGWVLPKWRGRGIGTELLRWGEAAAREMAVGRPGERFEFAGNASATERDSAALLLDAGYRPAYTVLEMGFDPAFPLQSASMPHGIELRPVASEHLEPIARCVADAYRHEFAGGRYQEVFDPVEWARELAEPKYDHSLWQVAWAGDAVVGEVLSEVEGDGAEVFEVSVAPRWRRRGIARSLMIHALSVLRARGFERIRLSTVAEFPTQARDLYTGVGFRVLKEFPRYRKPPA